MMIGGGVGVTGAFPTADLVRLLSAMTPEPAARFRLWQGGGAGLGCGGGAVLWRANGAAGTSVLLAGRIDNSGEVRRALGQSAQRLPDAGLLALAYERWGEDFLDPFVGDIACALWDGAARRLVLGRDPSGVEPLHYWTSGSLLLFASEPRGLLADRRVPRELDEGYLAAWLSLMPHQQTATPYRGIECIPPGAVLVAEGGRVRRHHFWRPERLPTLRLARDEDYADALRAALNEAVRCRLPATGLVGSMLSGGLDSSSVTAIAARQLAAQGRRLAAFTAVPGHPIDHALYPGKMCDEGPLAVTVARAYPNIDHILVRNDASPFLDAMDRRNLAMGRPVLNPGNLGWIDAVGREAQRRGIRVHLTGDNGNFTISYDGVLLPASLLRQGRLGALAGEARALHRTGRPWAGIASQTLGPLMPAGFRQAILRAFGRPERDLYGLTAISPAFARQTGAEERARTLGFHFAAYTRGDSRKLRLLGLHRLDRGLITTAMRRQFGVDFRDPTTDRRLVELCLSIPEEQFLRHGQPRALIRRAMQGILPPEILAERRRGRQNADWHVAFTAVRGEMLNELARLEASPTAQRCLDLPRLRRMLENWPQGGWHRREVSDQYCLALGRALSAGNFIRRFEGGNG